MTWPFDDVSDTSIAPSHDFKLVDGSGNKVLGWLAKPAYDPDSQKTIYNEDPEGLIRNTFPNQAVRFAQQGGEYADYQPPWQPFEQDTWEGGRGIRYFHKDKTRYADSYRVLTQTPHQITLAGAPRFSGGNFNGDAPLEHLNLMPGNFSGHTNRRIALYDSEKYIGRRFSPSFTLTANRLLIILGQTGTAPGTFRVDIYSDNAGVPNASLANGTLTVAAFGTDEISKTVSIDLSANVALTAGTNYWVIVQSVTNGSVTNNWWVLTDDTAVGVSIRSANGTVWSEASPYPAPYCVVADYHTSVTDQVAFRYFEYRGCLYCWSNPESNLGGQVFRHGWRGAADSNSGALDKLKDSTQTGWASSAAAGAIVKIIGGPGVDETQNWRNVTSSISGELTVSPPFLTEHTTATEYVVYNTDFWSGPLFGLTIKSVAVAGDIAYMSLKNADFMYRFREYNNAGVFVYATATVEAVYGERTLPLIEPETGRTALYGYNNDHALGPVYWKMYVPPAWGSLYRDLGELAPTTAPWNSVGITNVTQGLGEDGTKVTVAAGFATGAIAYHNLDTPLNVEQGNAIGLLLKSSVAVASAELQLVLNSQTYANQQRKLADRVFYVEPDPYEVATKVTTLVPSTGVHTDKPKIFDGSDASSDTIPLTTTNKLVVVFSKKVNSVQANVTVANVATPITLTMRYFNGEEFVAHTISGNFGGVVNTPFGVTGKQTVTFTLPGDWEQYTVDDGTDAVTGYALEFVVSGTITGTTALLEIAGKNTEAFNATALPLSKDARDDTGARINFKENGYLVVCYKERFSTARLEFSDTNTAGSDLGAAAYYFNGEKLTTTAITDGTETGGATFAQTANTDVVTVPDDWLPLTFEGVSDYSLWFKIAVDSGDSLDDETALDEVAVIPVNTVTTLNLGVIAANTWTWVAVSLGTLGAGHTNKITVSSVHLNLTADLGAQTIELKGGVRLISTNAEYKLLNGHRATNILTYNVNERDVPFILFQDQRHHYIDALNGDALVPVNITGFETIADETNGQAACHSGVYLYSNAGPRLFRYFEGSLESAGPDLDEGLPYDRQGPISFVIPYAGDAVIYGVDAASRNPNFTGSVILRSGSGVHELYRAPKGEPVRDGRIQVIKGTAVDRLWLNVGSHLIWLPISSYTTDPLKDLDGDGNSNFPYTHDGYIDLGYISDGALGLNKVYASVSIFSRNLSAGQLYGIIYYRMDADTTWTKVSTTLVTSPVQEITFATNYVRGKRLQVRVRLLKDGGQGLLTTPVIESIFIKAVTIYPASYTYDMNFLVVDYAEDLQGRAATHLAQVDVAQLDTWRNAGEVLTYTNPLKPWTNRKVILQSVNYKLAAIETNPHREEYFVNGRLLDITI